MSQTIKKFHAFHTSSLEQAAEAFRVLAAFPVRGREDDHTHGPSLWVQISTLGSVVQELSADTSPEAGTEKSVLAMFGTADVNSFMNAWKKWEDAFVTDIPADIPAPNVRMISTDEITSLYAGLSLSSVTANELVRVYDAMPDEQKQHVSALFVPLRELAEDLAHTVRLLAAFLNVDRTEVAYSMEELSHVMDGTMTSYSSYRLARTMRFIYETPELAVEANKVLYDHMRVASIYRKKDYDWEEAFFLTIFLHIAFLSIDKPQWFYQQFWMTYYLVRAYIAGVQVTEIMKKHLYNDTTNVVDYATENVFLYRLVSENEEELWKQKDGTVLVLAEFFNIYERRLGEKTADGYEREEFIAQTVEESPDKSLWQHVLREILYVYTHLKTVDLVPNNRGSIPTEKDIFDHQLERLLVWWLTEEVWDLIVQYFTEPDPKKVVPLRMLLASIREHESLEKEETRDTVLRFNEFLREHGVLKDEEDIIIYDEKSAAFSWNEHFFDKVSV